MKLFAETHPVWTIILSVIVSYGVLGLVIWLVRSIIRDVIMETVRQECLEKEWEWKKYHRTEPYKRRDPPSD